MRIVDIEAYLKNLALRAKAECNFNDAPICWADAYCEIAKELESLPVYDEKSVIKDTEQ